MSSQYKENNFSTENFSSLPITDQNKVNGSVKPNIDHLIKKILVERRREKKIVISLIVFSLSLILIFYFFQN
jgi:hypothetical protein